MAVDTRDKRASIAGDLPAPDSTIDVGDRAQSAGDYRGLIVSAAAGALCGTPLIKPSLTVSHRVKPALAGGPMLKPALGGEATIQEC
jgi:hypothetical protein